MPPDVNDLNGDVICRAQDNRFKAEITSDIGEFLVFVAQNETCHVLIPKHIPESVQSAEFR